MFYEGLKAFVKPFKAPQRSVKTKIELFFSYRTGLGREELKRYLCSKIHNFQGFSFFLSQQIDLLKEKLFFLCCLFVIFSALII